MVFSGNANGIKYNFDSHCRTVVIGWPEKHVENPHWLAPLVVRVLSFLFSVVGPALVDVIGFSRGVQAILCGYRDISCASVLSRVANIYLAGGCIWVRAEKWLASSILEGLARARTERGGRAPIRLLVVSRADQTVYYAGDHSMGKQVRRVDYWPIHPQLELFTERIIVETLATHSEVMEVAERQVCHVTEKNEWLPPAPHCVRGGLETALEQCYAAMRASPEQFSSLPHSAMSEFLVPRGRRSVRRPKLSQDAVRTSVYPPMLDACDVLWVQGACGVGKSTRLPIGLLQRFALSRIAESEDIVGRHTCAYVRIST